MANAYNIRVYGLRTQPEGNILVTDEIRNGFQMTKFPGGGHEFGEGLADTLRREWREELDRKVKIGDLFYVNDFLQISAFDKQDQLISFYYHVEPLNLNPVPTATKVFDFPEGSKNAQTFRWVPIVDLNPSDFTFPIDKIVADRFRRWWISRP